MPFLQDDLGGKAFQNERFGYSLLMKSFLWIFTLKTDGSDHGSCHYLFLNVRRVSDRHTPHDHLSTQQ